MVGMDEDDEPTPATGWRKVVAPADAAPGDYPDHLIALKLSHDPERRRGRNMTPERLSAAFIGVPALTIAFLVLRGSALSSEPPAEWFERVFSLLFGAVFFALAGWFFWLISTTRWKGRTLALVATLAVVSVVAVFARSHVSGSAGIARFVIGSVAAVATAGFFLVAFVRAWKLRWFDLGRVPELARSRRPEFASGLACISSLVALVWSLNTDYGTVCSTQSGDIGQWIAEALLLSDCRSVETVVNVVGGGVLASGLLLLINARVDSSSVQDSTAARQRQSDAERAVALESTVDEVRSIAASRWRWMRSRTRALELVSALDRSADPPN